MAADAVWPACLRRDAVPPCGTARFDDHRRCPGGAVVNGASTAADLILHNGRVTTLDRSNPTATAVAIRDGKFARVGGEADVMSLAGSATRVIDLKGRRVLPGLNDHPLHIIRVVLNFNMELRLDGVRT